MSDGVNIDWGLLKTPDYVGDYQNAFQAGRQMAGQGIQTQALTAFGQNPAAPIDPRLFAANPELAVQLQNRQKDAQDQQSSVAQAQAMAQGDLPGAMQAAAARGATGDVATIKAQIDALPEQQRAAAIQKAQQTNEALASVLRGLQGYPPEQRLGMAQHIAQQTGLIDPSTITADDVSDQGINAHLASSYNTDQWLRAQAQAETSRHNKVDEGFQGQNVALKGQEVAIAGGHLALDRAKFNADQSAKNPTPPAVPAAGGAPAGTAPSGGGIPISQVPQGDQAIVQALIDGRYAIPTGAALRNPQMVRYLQEAAQVDPTFDAANAQTRVATRKDFTAGKSAQTITSLNQALGHATEVANDISTLGNSNVPLIGPVLNAAKNAVSDPLTGDVTAFKTHAEALAIEASKVFQGGAPHEAEVARQTKIIADPNATQAQQRAAVQSLTELLGSRLDALKGQYTQGMGKSSTPLEVLHPGAAAAFSRLSHLRSSFGQGAPQSGPPGKGPVPHGQSQILSVE